MLFFREAHCMYYTPPPGQRHTHLGFLAGEWIDPQVEEVSGQEPYQEDCYIIEVTIDKVSRALDPQD